MKLIIQIPCLNEEKTLSLTIADLPRRIDGIDKIETLIINDGSTDRTLEVAKELGLDHIISFPSNKGLARAFEAGINECIRLGADIIVNTDGDNQYNGQDIVKLLQPILEGKADMVIGERTGEGVKEFSWRKRFLQKLGSRIVSRLAGIHINDVTSGFRAYGRNAAINLNIVSSYSYTLESLIQAGIDNMTVTSVKVGTNKKTRPSRLFNSTWTYLKASADTILRIYIMYRPTRTIGLLGLIILLLGLILGCTLLWFNPPHQPMDIQSLILVSILLIIGFIVMMMSILAELSINNRRFIEKALRRIKRLEMDKF